MLFSFSNHQVVACQKIKTKGAAIPPPMLKSIKYKGENERDRWRLGNKSIPKSSLLSTLCRLNIIFYVVCFHKVIVMTFATF
jgi:hypothetical protein